MLLLAIETAFEHCSVCLYKDNECVALMSEHAPRQQTKRILPMLEELLQKNSVTFADIDGLAFNRGPGSFSGIRINTAVIQALAFAHDLPCVPVSCLQAQAQAVFNAHADITDVCVINDAKMNEVYLANYTKNEHGVSGALESEHMLPCSYDDSTVITSTHVYGDGVACLELFASQHEPKQQLTQLADLEMNALHIAQVGYAQLVAGNTVTAEHAQPVYLRNKAWKTLAEQQEARQQKTLQKGL